MINVDAIVPFLDFDAIAPATASDTATDEVTIAAHPRLGGYRITDLAAVIGAVVWLCLAGLAASGLVALTLVELFVCLAVLVFVPLGLGLAATPRDSGGSTLLYTLPVVTQFPAALCVAAALALPVGSIASIALALPWVGVTGVIALFGLWRFGSRDLSPTPLPELAIDAALVYIPVGAIALCLHRAGISLRFSSLIILLTAIHYHYAGFVLPLVTGHVGRILADGDGRLGTGPAGRVATGATIIIIVNLALIAVGITFSPLVEVIAVSLFTVAVACFALLILVRVVPSLPRVAGGLLAVAAVSIFLTMALALGYGYSAFPRTGTLISISEMIRFHGSTNAFGFALPALVAFRLVE